ncbi:Transcriptional regulator, AraC type [Oleispira antarctica RB-8]|uniref:Transcriptional regulator, AraC type n=1 Tax=Oleispira antarctica RB-8 TaxID=698738 RepID=R4YRR0_OLEAN|nr:Transcriptional regulator, AraC type [Oleispira antarctica RB-8]
MKCILLLLENSPVTSVTGPMEIFSLANSLVAREQRMDMQLVSPSGAAVSCLGGLKLSVHDKLKPQQTPDLIVIGAIGHPELRPKDFDPEILGWLRQKHAQGSKIASICTGAFVLAASGLLDDLPATTHWQCASLFQQRFPKVRLCSEAMITQQNGLYCSAGASAYQDMSIRLVRDIFGQDVAQQCAKALLFDADRSGQSQYASFQPHRQHTDELIHSVQNWLDEHFMQDFSMVDLAEKVHLSDRQFKRRFKQAAEESPLAYVQALRIESAKVLLVSSSKPMSEISRIAGYEDMRFFRQLFKRLTSLSPSDYRQKFSLPG